MYVLPKAKSAVAFIILDGITSQGCDTANTLALCSWFDRQKLC